MPSLYVNLMDEDELDNMTNHQYNMYDIDNMSYEQLLELCNTIGYHNVGLTEEQKIDVTENYELTEEDKDIFPKCMICLHDFNEKQEDDDIPITRIKTCGHVFCKECIYQWLDDHKKCPVCVRDLLENNP